MSKNEYTLTEVSAEQLDLVEGGAAPEAVAFGLSGVVGESRVYIIY
jgi:hypothetical protein